MKCENIKRLETLMSFKSLNVLIIKSLVCSHLNSKGKIIPP